MIAFIANVGNRDIVLNIGSDDSPLFLAFDKGEEGSELCKFLGCPGGGARALGTHVRERLAELRPRLAFPILGRALEFALQAAGRLDLALLLGTDQPMSAGTHRRADTIESARVLQACLAETYKDLIARIEVQAVSANPSLHDAAFLVVGGILRNSVPPVDAATVFVAVKGGVPAMNAALREQGIGLYGAKLRLIDVQEPEERLAGLPGAATFRPTWPFRREVILRLAGTLLSRSDYEGLRLLLESEGICDPAIIAMLRHAHARLNLDFDTAAQTLDGSRTGRAAQWRTSAASAWSLQRLVDVRHAAQISLERQDFVGFLARVATFCENSRRQLAFALTGLRIEANLPPSAVTNAALRRCLSGRKGLALVGGAGSPWRADRPLFNAVVAWYLTQRADKDVGDRVHEVQEQLGHIGSLEKLRHETLHLMRGVGSSDIEGALPSALSAFATITKAVLDALLSIERMLGAPEPVVVEVYRDLNEAVLASLEAYSPDELQGPLPCS